MGLEKNLIKLPLPLPFPIPGGGGIAGGIFSFLLKKAWKIIRDFMNPPKESETPKEVIACNDAFRIFCQQVNQEAKQIETASLQHLENYCAYLENIDKTSAGGFLKKYKISTRGMVRQMNFLKMQIPGLIGSEVSRRLSDTDAECLQIRKMLPGTEKEAKMQSFMGTVINNAVEKCAQTVASITQELQDSFIDDLQDSLELSKQQLECAENDFKALGDAENDLPSREQVRLKAQQTAECCEMIINLLS